MDETSTKPAKERVILHQKFHKEIMRWLRKAYSWSGIQTLAKSKARVARGKYECQYCGNIVGTKEFEIDHFDPCIAVDENPHVGYDYNGIIIRMFSMENSFLACKPCHRAKTGKENSKRKKGVPMKPATKKKIQKTNSKPEMKELVSKRNKGRKHTTIARRKISTSNIGRKGVNAKNHVGYWITPKGSFTSVSEAAEANSCSRSSVHHWCKTEKHPGWSFKNK